MAAPRPPLLARLSQSLQAIWSAPRPGLAARALQPLSWLYMLLAALPRAAFDLGLRQRGRAPVPLVVVGNLVAGGAGKTPAVIAIVEQLRQRGWTPGVVARGYGRTGQGVRAVTRDSLAAAVGDEPLLIHLRTGAPVVVGADRLAAARALCATHADVDVLVADDGLQHHRLARDVEVLVFDDRGVGNGLRLPAGPLRQALPATLSPRQLVLYSAGRPSTPLPGFVGQRRLASLQPLADWWQGAAAAPGIAQTLAGRPLLAVAGLARPQPFFAMLGQLGLTIVGLPLPDHHSLHPLPWPAHTPDVVMTEKDAVKLRAAPLGATRVWVARLDFEPETDFASALQSRLTRPGTPTSRPSP
jgi:tetraacyldisaccharide 4'-kinase